MQGQIDSKLQDVAAPLEYAVAHVQRQDRSEVARHQLIDALVALPLIVATLISVIASLWSLGFRLKMPYSQNPWESAILADAYRASRGQAVYESVKNPRGHATHLYGPLASQAIGLIYRITGPNWYAGRALSLACSLVACAVLLLAFADVRKPLEMIVGAGLLIALHYRGRAYFVETRPDMIAVLLATVSLIAFCRAHRTGKLLWYLPGITLLITGMLFKQTYAAAAVVPMGVCALGALGQNVLHPSRRLAWHFLAALTPVIAVVGTLSLMWLFAPNVWYHVVTVPSLYKVPFTSLVFRTVQVLTLSPLFVALAVWFTIADRDRIPKLREPKMLWLVVATVVGAGAGIMAAAKRGGSYNSLLLGWVPMTAFCVAMIGPMIERILSRATVVEQRLGAIGSAWFVALLILVMTFDVPKSDLWNFTGAHGGPEFPQVVEAVKNLKGRMTCPDDPMLELFARGDVGRSLEAELDAVNRPGRVPERLANEIKGATWLMRVHGNYDGYLTPEMLARLGFRQVRDAGPPFGGKYTLWRRSPSLSATTEATTQPGKRKKADAAPVKPRNALPPEDMP